MKTERWFSREAGSEGMKNSLGDSIKEWKKEDLPEIILKEQNHGDRKRIMR